MKKTTKKTTKKTAKKAPATGLISFRSLKTAVTVGYVRVKPNLTYSVYPGSTYDRDMDVSIPNDCFVIQAPCGDITPPMTLAELKTLVSGMQEFIDRYEAVTKEGES